MATEVNTGLWSVHVGVPPGISEDWFQSGQTYGKVRWFNAHLLGGRPWTRAVEIERVYHVRTPPPADDLEVDVVWRNIGSNSATFAIFYAETVSP